MTQQKQHFTEHQTVTGQNEWTRLAWTSTYHAMEVFGLSWDPLSDDEGSLRGDAGGSVLEFPQVALVMIPTQSDMAQFPGHPGDLAEFSPTNRGSLNSKP